MVSLRKRVGLKKVPEDGMMETLDAVDAGCGIWTMDGEA